MSVSGERATDGSCLLPRGTQLLPDKTWNIWDILKEFIASEGNYQRYREVLRDAVPPIIPYLGIHLTDLVFLDEGNPDLLPDTNLLNFWKVRACVRACGWRDASLTLAPSASLLADALDCGCDLFAREHEGGAVPVRAAASHPSLPVLPAQGRLGRVALALAAVRSEAGLTRKAVVICTSIVSPASSSSPYCLLLVVSVCTASFRGTCRRE